MRIDGNRKFLSVKEQEKGKNTKKRNGRKLGRECKYFTRTF